jgi:hypothetical protein
VLAADAVVTVGAGLDKALSACGRRVKEGDGEMRIRESRLVKASRLAKRWEAYEQAVTAAVEQRWPNHEILWNQPVPGRKSNSMRQVDVLIRGNLVGESAIGVLECKLRRRKIDVGDVDKFCGFVSDVGAAYGGMVSCVGFTAAAKSKASAERIELRFVPFESIEQVAEAFQPRLDFSDSWNSMYIPLLFCDGF